jgi:thiol-disulfide isomerase/thioredoxin
MNRIAPHGGRRRRPGLPGELAAALGLLAALAQAGCGPSGASGDAPAADGRRGHYEALTEGSVEDLARHIDQLKQRFEGTNEAGPEEAQASLVEYLGASAETARAIVERPGLNPEVRDRIAGLWVEALMKKLDADRTPEALADVERAADALIERYPGTELATRAKYLKLDVLRTAPDAALPDPDERFDRIIDAAVVLGRAEPPSDKAADILSSLGYSLEIRGENARALQLYELLTERFPDHQSAPLTRGTVHRLGLQGQPVGEIRGKDFDGKPVALEDLKGKVVLVDFWATWCGPCLAELPEIRRLRETLGPDGFEVLGICVDRDRDAVGKFLSSQKIDWPQIVVMQAQSGTPAPAFGIGVQPPKPDPDAADEEAFQPNQPSELERRFGAGYLPLKLLVDRDGRLVTSGHQLGLMLEPLDALFPGKGLRPDPAGARPPATE